MEMNLNMMKSQVFRTICKLELRRLCFMGQFTREEREEMYLYDTLDPIIDELLAVKKTALSLGIYDETMVMVRYFQYY
jgi:hypothetical protein